MEPPACTQQPGKRYKLGMKPTARGEHSAACHGSNAPFCPKGNAIPAPILLSTGQTEVWGPLCACLSGRCLFYSHALAPLLLACLNLSEGNHLTRPQNLAQLLYHVAAAVQQLGRSWEGLR